MHTIRQVGLLVVSLCFLTGCNPDPQVSGRPLSFWVSSLNDQDVDTVNDALMHLAKVDKAQCGRAYQPLRTFIADPHRADLSRGRAAALLSVDFAENNPSSIPYLFAVLRFDPDQTMQLFAAGALAKMPDHADAIIPQAIEVLTSRRSGIARQAATMQILQAIGTPALPALEAVPPPDDLLTRATVEATIEKIKKSDQIKR